MYYDGGPLINDSETRTELAESENQSGIDTIWSCRGGWKNSAPADLVVDEDESSVSDFLIGYLNEYIQSEGYLDRKANYEAIFGNEENNFSVTRVINLSADNIGSDKLSIRRTKKTPWSSRFGYCCIAFWTAMIMTAASS